MFRKNNNNIVVRNTSDSNEKILNPVQTFAQAFKLYPEIMREIEKQGFQTPSPIQAQSWPILLSGKDLIGIAQTGTGIFNNMWMNFSGYFLHKLINLLRENSCIPFTRFDSY